MLYRRGEIQQEGAPLQIPMSLSIFYHTYVPLCGSSRWIGSRWGILYVVKNVITTLRECRLQPNRESPVVITNTFCNCTTINSHEV